MRMQETVMLEGQEFPIHITRHGRARRYVLKFDSENDIIKLTVPKRASIKGGVEFTQSRANWLFQQMHKAGERIQLEPGITFPLLGLPTLLAHQPGRGVAELDEMEQPQMLTIHGHTDFFSSRLKRYLQNYLREFIQPIAKDYAGQLGVSFRKISVRDTKSHWGSCAPDGSLSFAFRLVFAEPDLVDYIVAHEVAHLREMNHSPAFWKHVEQICPDYKQQKQWFKAHGGELEQYML